MPTGLLLPLLHWVGMKSCDRNLIAHKAYNISFLVLYGKGEPTSKLVRPDYPIPDMPESGFVTSVFGLVGVEIYSSWEERSPEVFIRERNPTGGSQR